MHNNHNNNERTDIRKKLREQLAMLEQEAIELQNEIATKYDLTELGNGKRFADRVRGELVFVPESDRWYLWNGKRWESDETGHVLRQFEQTIMELKVGSGELVKAFSELDDEQQKEAKRQLNNYVRWINQSQKLAVMRNSLTLAAAQEDMTATITDFDSKGQFFGCANGIIGLRDGSLITDDKKYRITKSSPVTYNPGAVAPEWKKFLLKIMEGKPEMVAFLQRMIGQAMFGTQGKDKLFVFWGTGANGKSTFVDTLSYVFGQYATVTDPSMLTENSYSNREYYIAPLKGTRLLLLSETKAGDVLAESIVKKVIDSGQVTGRYPAGRVFTFQPVFTPILSTNKKPRIGADPATWRRILLVPFTYTIPEGERNPRFRTEMLAPEAEGILKWCVDGAIAYQQMGLNPPDEVLAATNTYKDEQDKLGMFIRELCVEAGNVRTKLKDLLDRYNAWCLDQGLKPVGVVTFKEELAARRIEVRMSTNHQNWVFGLGLASDNIGLAMEKRRAGGFFE